jgi:hypothetical protein
MVTGCEPEAEQPAAVITVTETTVTPELPADQTIEGDVVLPEVIVPLAMLQL